MASGKTETTSTTRPTDEAQVPLAALQNLAGYASGMGRTVGAEYGGLPSWGKAMEYLSGSAPELVGMSNRAIQPMMEQARLEARNMASDILGGSAVGSAMGGVMGASASGAGRALAGRNAGNILSRAMLGAQQMYGTGAMGQRMYSGIADAKTRNMQQMGSLLGLGGQMYGNAAHGWGTSTNQITKETPGALDYAKTGLGVAMMAGGAGFGPLKFLANTGGGDE